MKVYIKGNYIDDNGVGHHGEVVEVTEWMRNKLVNSHDAVDEEEWNRSQEAKVREREEAEAFEEQRKNRVAGTDPGAPGQTSTDPGAPGQTSAATPAPTAKKVSPTVSASGEVSHA